VNSCNLSIVPISKNLENSKGLSGFYTNMVLSIASQKGGTGKTTTAITLSASLGRLGKKVLLVDIDSQANASKVLIPNYMELRQEETIYATILERKPLPVHYTQFPGLDIVPSHILLSDTDIELSTAKDHREARLKSKLDNIKSQYDHVLIDCPPALSWLTINALTASDYVLVVISPGYFELDSIVQINKTINEVRELFNQELDLAGYLFTMSDPTINSRTSLKLLRQTYPSDVLKTVIPRNTDLRDAHFNKTDIHSYAPKSKGALAYTKLMKELFKDGKKIK
jgi:chromosome partitioning protein